MTDGFVSDPETFYRLVSLRTRRDAGFSAKHLQWIDQSVGHGLYHVFDGLPDQPIGYVIWAYVNEETVERLYRYGKLPTYGYEWSEGVITLVLDVVYVSPGDRLSRETLRSAFPRDIDRLAFFRRGRTHLYRVHRRGAQRVTLDQFNRINRTGVAAPALVD